MATEHADDGPTGSGTETSHDRDRPGVGPIALVWYGGLFGIGFLVFLAGAKNAVALYTGAVYPDVPAAYLGITAALVCLGSILLLYGLYGTARTAVQEASA